MVKFKTICELEQNDTKSKMIVTAHGYLFPGDEEPRITVRTDS